MMSIFSQRITQGGEGCLVTVKDRFDVQGLLTLIVSQAYENSLPAQQNTDVAQRFANAADATATPLRHAATLHQHSTQQTDETLQQRTAMVLPTLPAFPIIFASAIADQTDLDLSALACPRHLSGDSSPSLSLKTQTRSSAALQRVGLKDEDDILCELTRMQGKYIPIQNNKTWSIQ